MVFAVFERLDKVRNIKCQIKHRISYTLDQIAYSMMASAFTKYFLHNFFGWLRCVYRMDICIYYRNELDKILEVLRKKNELHASRINGREQSSRSTTFTDYPNQETLSGSLSPITLDHISGSHSESKTPKAKIPKR